MLEVELITELLTDDRLLPRLELATSEDEVTLELDVTPQLAAIFSVVLTIVLLASFFTTIRVQPLAGVSAAGNESVPQPPLGSTLKRGTPVVTGAKLRQISSVVVEPATAVNRSPSAQPLWVPRKWKPFKGADDELAMELEIAELLALLEMLLEASELLEILELLATMELDATELDCTELDTSELDA